MFISERPKDLGSFITMLEFFSTNTLKTLDAVKSNYLSHALVMFIDLESIS